MKNFKRFLAVLCAIVIVGGMVASITCTYYYHLNIKALWWSWILAIFVIDLSFGLAIFYNQKRPDETKAFWLLVIVLLPILGCCLLLLFGLKKDTNFTNSDNNHAKLLHSIFSAKKSIKIYSDNFYPSLDTFNALNFVCYKDVKVQLILTTQLTKSKQEYLEYKLEQMFDKKVKLFFTNVCIEKSFIIIDDNKVISAPQNFNFKHIYSSKKLMISDEITSSKELWDSTLVRSSEYNFRNAHFSRAKKLKFSIINIFYSFL